MDFISNHFFFDFPFLWISIQQPGMLRFHAIFRWMVPSLHGETLKWWVHGVFISNSFKVSPRPTDHDKGGIRKSAVRTLKSRSTPVAPAGDLMAEPSGETAKDLFFFTKAPSATWYETVRRCKRWNLGKQGLLKRHAANTRLCQWLKNSCFPQHALQFDGHTLGINHHQTF